MSETRATSEPQGSEPTSTPIVSEPVTGDTATKEGTIMDEATRQPEPGRRAEAPRRAMDAARHSQQEATRAMAEITRAGAETMGIWAQTSQRALRELTELSAGTAAESVRLYTDIQQTTLNTIQEVQSATMQWLVTWPEAFRDPMRWYQRTVESAVEGAHKNFGMMRDTAEAFTETARRLNTSAEEVTRNLQDTFTSAATRMKDLRAA